MQINLRRMSPLAGMIFLAACPAFGGSTCPIVGDLDLNGTVGAADLALLLGAWGTPDELADLDGNGNVGAEDLAALLGAWGDAGYVCGTFPEQWIFGGNCAADPVIQVHQYNANTYILRQSLCTNFEAPFLYLLFGDEKVLLEDTGAGGIPVADTVYGIIADWQAEHAVGSLELIVAHSHAHGDHVAGDGQFIGQPATTVVGLSQTAVASFFQISNWPEQIVTYDLGGRILDVIPIPGHQSAHIAFYDRQTHLLLTGDTIYPGRLYISNFTQYLASIGRLVDFVQDNPIVWLMGTHVEMSSTPGLQFPIGSTYHPHEHELQLAPPILDELYGALLDMQDDPFIEVHDEFVIWPF